MVTLTFVFDKDKLKKTGQSEDALLQPMRSYARKYKIDEKEYGVFSKDGDDALSLMTMFVTRFSRKNPNYISYLGEWTLDVDGDTEDCIEEMRKIYKSRKIQPMVAG